MAPELLSGVQWHGGGVYHSSTVTLLFSASTSLFTAVIITVPMRERRSEGKRVDSMKTLVIAGYDRMKARTVATARGEHEPARGEPTVWFTSTERDVHICQDAPVPGSQPEPGSGSAGLGIG